MDTVTFKDLENLGWRDRAEDYACMTAPTTTQCIPALLDAVGAHAGIELVDICCGPGFGAAAAAGLGARATGIDFAPEMIEIAQRNFPHAAFHVGDAEALDAPDARFDAAICSFGILHVADADAMLKEACRVLRPGGRLAFTTWCGPEESALFAIVLKAVQEHAAMDVGLPPAPPLFRFADPAEGRRTLEEIGFTAVTTRQLPITMRVERDGFMNFFMRFGVRTPMLLDRQTDEARLAIREAIESGLRAFEEDGFATVPMPAMLTAARKA